MNTRMPHPTASIQAPPTPDMRRPNRWRNHVKGTVRKMKAIGLYSVKKRKISIALDYIIVPLWDKTGVN